MKRLAKAFSLGVLIATSAFPTTAHARATFDAQTGSLHLANDVDTLRSYDFETPEGVKALSFVKRGQDGDLSAATSDTAFDPNMLTDAEDAVEGSHALRLNTTGLLLRDDALFQKVKDGKFEVTYWTRADGSRGELQVFYGKDATALGYSAFASVRGIPTGRETSDGWVEFVAGPLEGSIWGVPVAGITITQSRVGRGKTTSFLVDALEVRRLPGTTQPALVCTQDNVDDVCGAEGDCMFGHCVSSTVTWGLLPSASQAKDIADRWTYFASRLIGDRNAAAYGRTTFAETTKDLPTTAKSSRQFFGALNRLVNGLRDNHTSFGSPTNFSTFAPQLSYATSSVLGACFGVVDKDLAGGGLGYAVFQATESPLTKKPLRRGDFVVAIDGKDPKAWVDAIWPRFARAMSNDPSSDWGPSANDLSRLIALRASNVTLSRCASKTACGDADRETFTIDLHPIVYDAIVSGTPDDVSASILCSQRFSDTVPNDGNSGDGSEDPVYTTIGSDGETRIQFDGFVANGNWEASFTKAFASRPAEVLMDARMGHGGVLTAVQHLLDILRSKSDPMGVLMLGRGTYEFTDPSWIFTDLQSCGGSSGNSFWLCMQANASGSFTSNADPTGVASRVAWLNTYDVSANDFMPRLLKGRANFKIFAPHPTSGAFGAIISLPPQGYGWSGGSIQIQDSRFSTDLSTIADKRWESGHGVEPDVVVAEKLSDAIDGVDTIVETAKAWLKSQ